MTILGSALDNPRLPKAQQELIWQVLYAVVCACEPLTVQCLSGLLQINDFKQVRTAPEPLWPVLHVIEGSEVVATLHTSFLDFIFDPTLSKTYWCDSNIHHRKLTKHLFDHIAQTQPQFNICGLESLYLSDKEVPNIQARVAECISSELLYACQYWADHVKTTNHASSIVKHLQDFLSTRLLLWMEVLNLTNYMKVGMECMKLVDEWCQTLEGEQELTKLADDAKRFVDAFASNPVSESTPHIYVLMLAFWPRSTPIAKYYAKYTRGPVEGEGTALDQQLLPLSTWAFEDCIKAIAVSPDGLHIGSATGRNVLVVHPSSGRAVLGPLKGHSKEIKAIAFSPDGS